MKRDYAAAETASMLPSGSLNQAPLIFPIVKMTSFHSTPGMSYTSNLTPLSFNPFTVV